jgi:hypothetical protein
MTKKASSIDDVRAALPAVQAALRADLAARIAAGESIARTEGDTIISRTAPLRTISARRKELLDQYDAARVDQHDIERKSVA